MPYRNVTDFLKLYQEWECMKISHHTPPIFTPVGVSLPLKIAVCCPSPASARVGESTMRKMTK